MPVPGKRVTRKELRQPDRFLVLTGAVLDFLRRYRSAAIAIGAAALLAFVVAVGWSFYRERQYRLAAEEYARALQMLRAGNYRAALTAFESLSQTGPNPYARYALLYQANVELALNQPQQAIGTLDRLLRAERRDPTIRQVALFGRSQEQERLGHIAAACQGYAEAAKLDGPLKEPALIGLGRCRTEAKDIPGAIQAYNEYLASFPNSDRAAEVTLRLRLLEAKSAGGAQK